MGIREGWAQRRRDGIHIRLRPPDMLACNVGSRTYYLRFVPRPRPLPRPRRWPRLGRRGGLALAVSLLLHALCLGLLGRPLWPTRAELPRLRLAWAQAQPETTAAGAAVGAALGPAHAAVLGAAPPYWTFGVQAAGPTYDPQRPAPGKDVPLGRVAAFLRGDGTALATLLPPERGGGPSWRLQLDAAQAYPSRDDGLSPAQLREPLQQAGAALSDCYGPQPAGRRRPRRPGGAALAHRRPRPHPRGAGGGHASAGAGPGGRAWAGLCRRGAMPCPGAAHL